MKFLIIFVFLIAVKCEFDPKTFDWSSVKPITATKEYREAYPWRFTNESVEDNTKIFDRNGRVVGGNQASPTEFPFAVGILISFTENNGWCSGSLVSRNFILSAAQCFVGSETQVTALIGASDITRVSEFLLVSQYIKHENFNFNSLDNDIALLRMQREVQLNANVQIIRLPNRRQVGSSFEKQKARVAG
jgi:secreted trypsin-like serine protease